ncbi:hypothetical protein F0U59_23390 [Archangium gephyra]|nr:hypothetical protein F0U59_23390 [Archangium gephyra]
MLRIIMFLLLALGGGCTESSVVVSATVRNARAVPMSFWIELARVEDGKWTTVANSEHPPIAPGEAVSFSPVKVDGGTELYLSVRTLEDGVFFDQKALHAESGASGSLRAVFQVGDDGLSAQWE